MKKFLILLFILALSNPVYSLTEGFSVGASDGTLGSTLQVGYRFRENSVIQNMIGFRFEYNDNEKTSFHEDVSGLNYNSMTTESWSNAIFFDVYPLPKTWILENLRFTWGYYLSGRWKTDLRLYTENNMGEIFIGGRSHWPMAWVGNEIEMKAYVARNLEGPYYGLGLDIPLFFGSILYFDAGAIFTEKADTNFEVSGGTWGTPVDQWEKDAEATEIRREFTDGRTMLITKLGIKYNF